MKTEKRSAYSDFEAKFGVSFEDFVKGGELPDDREKSDDVLGYAYHSARAHNHLPRMYNVGMILRDRILSSLEKRNEQRGIWNWIQVKRLQKRLNRLEDELYVVNDLAHLVPFEKYEFMSS